MYKYGVLYDLDKNRIPEEHFKILEESVETICTVKADDPDRLLKLKDADLVLVNYIDFTAQMINAAPNLKYIGAISTAFEYIDMEVANEKGILVTNLGAYSKEAVAEFVFAAILAEFRELRKANEQAKDKKFNFEPFMGTELMNKNIGVLGAGRIGSRVCEIAAGFNMKVSYFARSEKSELESKGAKKADLEEIFKDSDIIVNTLPHDDSTEDLINESLFKKLKEKCMIVSITPIGVVNEDDLIRDLKANPGHYYVTDQAEDFSADRLVEYSQLENVTLYPNLAFRTAEANDARWRILCENVRDSLTGNKSNVVSK